MCSAPLSAAGRQNHTDRCPGERHEPDPSQPSHVPGAASAASALAPWGAFAQAAYPTRPVKVIVPYAAGGGTDFSRVSSSAPWASSSGSNSSSRTGPAPAPISEPEAAARAEPDGYTLLLGDTATFATNRTLYRKISFDPYKDFSPISLTGRFALVLLVNTNKLPVTSVQEIVAEAKKTPGRINYATPGLGSPFHLATELAVAGTGIKLTHVPYRGAAPAVQDLVAGQVDMMFIDFATARSQISGPIRAVAVASPQEFAGLPGVAPVAAHHQGLRGLGLAGLRRAGGDAARDHREAQRDLSAGGRQSGDPRQARRGRHRRAAELARRDGGLYAGGGRQVGYGHQNGRHHPGIGRPLNCGPSDPTGSSGRRPGS